MFLLIEYCRVADVAVFNAPVGREYRRANRQSRENPENAARGEKK
ncbi:hypothetical protein [Mesorhizobium sp. M0145]